MTAARVLVNIRLNMSYIFAYNARMKLAGTKAKLVFEKAIVAVENAKSNNGAFILDLMTTKTVVNKNL